jgi:hypothetical protein
MRSTFGIKKQSGRSKTANRQTSQKKTFFIHFYLLYPKTAQTPSWGEQTNDFSNLDILGSYLKDSIRIIRPQEPKRPLSRALAFQTGGKITRLSS